MILLPKHQSTWETFAFPTLMPRPLCYVFKRELLFIPFFGWAMARMDLIHIDRSKRAEAWSKVAEQGRRYMAQGNWVIMFPEGTRTPRGGQGTYKVGGTRLAVETGRPVVPIAVTSARCWPRKSFLLRPGVIDISIGAPIDSGRAQRRLADARSRALDRGRDAAARSGGVSVRRADGCGFAAACAGSSIRCSAACSTTLAATPTMPAPRACRPPRRPSPLADALLRHPQATREAARSTASASPFS